VGGVSDTWGMVLDSGASGDPEYVYCYVDKSGITWGDNLLCGQANIYGGEKMKSVFISGPYTGMKDEEYNNMMKAARVGAHYLKLGFAVFCPHTMTYPIDRNYNTGGEIEYEDWLELGLYWLAKCDIVAFLPGWENSKGATIEHMVARSLGKEIEYVRNE